MKIGFIRSLSLQFGSHLGDQGLEPKAILLLDNCPAHAPDLSLVSGDRKIKVYYLPKNTTAKIQPLDQGIITNFKIKYRNELKQAVVQDPHNILELLKNINLKTSFYLAGAAWNKVKPTIINNCFIKALRPILDPEEEVEDFESLMMSKIQAASTNIEADPDTHQQKLIRNCPSARNLLMKRLSRKL